MKCKHSWKLQAELNTDGWGRTSSQRVKIYWCELCGTLKKDRYYPGIEIPHTLKQLPKRV